MIVIVMKRYLFHALFVLACFVSSQKLAAESIVFQDAFENSMKDGWTWIRENAEAHRLRDGALELRLLPGNMWGGVNDARNVLLRPAPNPANGNVEVTVHAENRPTEQYEQVDLVWYYDDSHMVKIGQELVDGELSLVMGREEQDRTRTLAIIPLSTDQVTLRLLVHENRIIGSFKPAGAHDWIRAGECDLPKAGSPHVSLQAYQGPKKVERWARISSLVVRQPAELRSVDIAQGPDVPPETPSARRQRYTRVADRRTHFPILVHRGATRFAPENTVAALEAAMQQGADGVEFDIRRSKDGILYLFHDETLERMTDQTGPVQDLAFEELRQCQLTGGGNGMTIPRLEDAFALARRHAMLLHLDVKEPGLEKQLAHLLDKYDVWTHVVSVNDYNTESLRKDPRCRQLAYKGWLPQETPPDWAAIDKFLQQPGAMIFCKEDPTLAVQARKRIRK